MTVVVLNNQSLIDIAIQCYGSAFSVYDLALANNLAVTDDVIPGTVLMLPSSEYLVKDIADYFSRNKIKPATDVISTTSKVVVNTEELEVFPLKFPIIL